MADNDVLEYVKQSFDLKAKGFYKQAIEMLYKALEIENDNNELLFQLGELYFLLNNYPRAVQYIEKIFKLSTIICGIVDNLRFAPRQNGRPREH